MTMNTDVLCLLQDLEKLDVAAADDETLADLGIRLYQIVGKRGLCNRCASIRESDYNRLAGFYWKIVQELYVRDASFLDLRQIAVEMPDIIEGELAGCQTEELLETVEYYEEMAEQDRSFRPVLALVDKELDRRCSGSGSCPIN